MGRFDPEDHPAKPLALPGKEFSEEFLPRLRRRAKQKAHFVGRPRTRSTHGTPLVDAVSTTSRNCPHRSAMRQWGDGEMEPLTVVNMVGETETWSWEKPYGERAPGSQPIQAGNIQVLNLRSK
jgi:hypothetical protein